MSGNLTIENVIKAKDTFENSTASPFGGIIVHEDHVRQLEAQSIELLKRAEKAEAKLRNMDYAIYTSFALRPDLGINECIKEAWDRGRLMVNGER